MPNEGKGSQGHHHQDGEKYQAAILKALAGCLFEAVQDPVGGEIQQDGSKREIYDFHGCPAYSIIVKKHVARMKRSRIQDEYG